MWEEVKVMRKLMHRSKGFTLIELMIVILIIAILVGIAIPVYLAARTNAQRRTCQANLRTIDGAINTYYADGEAYPGSMANMVGPVLKSEPFCPTTGATAYGFSAAGSDPPVVSCPTNPNGNHTI